jgi:dihydrofolate reductase
VAKEAAAALDATDKDVSIGGAGLAAAGIQLGLVDELRMCRNPIVVGGGTPFLPPVTEDIPLHLIETRMFGSRVIDAHSGGSYRLVLTYADASAGRKVRRRLRLGQRHGRSPRRRPITRPRRHS